MPIACLSFTERGCPAGAQAPRQSLTPLIAESLVGVALCGSQREPPGAPASHRRPLELLIGYQGQDHGGLEAGGTPHDRLEC